MPSDDWSLEVVNIVVAGELGTGNIDTEAVGEDIRTEIVTTMPGRTYVNPTEDEPVVMIFRSGKYVIAGAKSESEIKSVTDWIISELARLGVDTNPDVIRESQEYRYRVVKSEFEGPIDLHQVILELGMENTEYEPEQFPAVIYRPEDSESAVLLFSTGSVLVTGTLSDSTAELVLQNIYDRLSESNILP